VVLHCNGSFDERREVADACPPLAGEGRRRADLALAMRYEPAPFDIAAAREEFAAMGVSA
jgi:beta-N-acetylhexosaminidase